MKKAFCTISSESHLFKSRTLLSSVRKYSDADLFCLNTEAEVSFSDGIFFESLQDLKSDAAAKIKGKYSKDKLRWALKPVYLQHLLDKGYDQVIYCDNDIFFYTSPDFLFGKLEISSFLLTPHFYKADPQNQQNWFEANFRIGLYNAGFIGVSKAGTEILDWWTNCCLYQVRKAFWRGLFDDQKYLDLVPVLFDHVEVVKHKGCNLAGWNYENYKLTRDENQSLHANLDPLVFIHFAALSMSEFSNTENPLYTEYKTYLTALKEFNPDLKLAHPKLDKRQFGSFFYYLRWQIARKFER